MADPIIVESTDGQRFQFPAGTDRLTMKRAIDEHYRSTAVGQGGAPVLPPDPPPAPPRGTANPILAAADIGELMSPAAPVRAVLGSGADWLRTGAVNALGAAGDFGQMFSPAAPVKGILERVAPEFVNALNSTRLARDLAHKEGGAPVVNTPKEYGGKVTDAARDAAIGSIMFPGSGLRNVIPAAVGGATSELAGQATEGKWYEVPARIAAGVAGGTVAAGVQETGRAGLRGVRNVLGRDDPGETASRIVSRAIERDKMTPRQLVDQTKALGDDAMLVDAGGENVRGALRGSIAAPGEARTTVRNVFADRAEKEGSRVAGTIDRNVSPKGLTQTVDDLVEARAKASAPAYEAAGIPRDPKAYATAPQLQGDAVKQLIADSADVRRALAAARRLPDYKNLPDTSMVLLDKAYKHIGGMEQEAARAGNNVRARDLKSLRESLAAAIDAENKNYSVALAKFSEPSKLIDAADMGRKLFAGNARPDEVRRVFAALPDDAKEAFRIGVAEHLRKTAGARDAGGVGGRVLGGPDAQARLRAVLGKEEADRLLADLSREKTFTRTARDVGQGSRTTPMALEADDNAGAVSALARGEPVNALLRTLKGAGSRLTEGRTERVNARVAEILTSMKPEDQAAFAAALEQSILRQRLNAPSNAFRAGAGAPLPGATNRRE